MGFDTGNRYRIIDFRNYIPAQTSADESVSKIYSELPHRIQICHKKDSLQNSLHTDKIAILATSILFDEVKSYNNHITRPRIVNFFTIYNLIYQIISKTSWLQHQYLTFGWRRDLGSYDCLLVICAVLWGRLWTWSVHFVEDESLDGTELSERDLICSSTLLKNVRNVLLQSNLSANFFQVRSEMKQDNSLDTNLSIFIFNIPKCLKNLSASIWKHRRNYVVLLMGRQDTPSNRPLTLKISLKASWLP